MFKNVDIAQEMQLGPDKVGYIVSFGLAHFFKERILNQLTDIRDNVRFTICFDECYNVITHKCQFDVHLLYFDLREHKIVRQFLGSAFLGHTRTSDLKDGLLKVLGKLDFTHALIQLSMDGPKVNWSLLKEIGDLKTEKDPDSPQLLDLGSCSLHVLHGAYGAGQSATHWNICQFLRACYKMFKDSPARRHDYLHINDLDIVHSERASSYLFPLKYCSHRWLENLAVISRIIEVFDKLKAYVRSVQKRPYSQQPQIASFQTLKTNLERDSDATLCLAKLEFSKFVIDALEPFLRQFQAEKPLAVFLYENLKTILVMMLRIVVKPHLLDDISHKPVKLMAIDLDDKNNLQDHGLDKGFGAKKHVKNLSPAHQLEFRESCRNMLVALLKKVCEHLQEPFLLFHHS